MSVLLGSASALAHSANVSRSRKIIANFSNAGNSTSRERCWSTTVKLAMVPLAAIVVSSSSADLAQAGILSGYRGWNIELPQISLPDSVKDNAEKQRKKYEGFDADRKKSPLLQELLKRSKENAAKRKQEIEDKYCERQAEWGVGDCSLEYSTPEEKQKFVELMKKKRAETEKIGQTTASNEQESAQITSPTQVEDETTMNTE